VHQRTLSDLQSVRYRRLSCVFFKTCVFHLQFSVTFLVLGSSICISDDRDITNENADDTLLQQQWQRQK